MTNFRSDIQRVRRKFVWWPTELGGVWHWMKWSYVRQLYCPLVLTEGCFWLDVAWAESMDDNEL